MTTGNINIALPSDECQGDLADVSKVLISKWMRSHSVQLWGVLDLLCAEQKTWLPSFLGILSTPLSGARSDMLRQREDRAAVRLAARERVILIKAGQWIRIFFIGTEITGLKLSDVIKNHKLAKYLRI